MSFTKAAARLSATFSIACLAAVLAACATFSEKQGPTMDLFTAKESTRNQQDELMSAVPSDDVSSTVQSETSGALFECESGGYYWPGNMDVVLGDSTDGAALLQQIKADWSVKDGWTVTEKTSVNGHPELEIFNQEGFRHSIEYSPDRNALNVLSSSACFQMKGKPEPGVQY